MKNCIVCNEPLNKEETKENRTEHYACRQVKLFNKNYQNIASNRRESAIKQMIKFPKVMRDLFSI